VENRRDVFVVGITKGIHIIAIAIPFSSYGQNSYLGNTNKHVSMAQEITDAWRLEELIIKPISQKIIIPYTLVQHAQELE
jgi:hypothetical protein